MHYQIINLLYSETNSPFNGSFNGKPTTLRLTATLVRPNLSSCEFQKAVGRRVLESIYHRIGAWKALVAIVERPGIRPAFLLSAPAPWHFLAGRLIAD